MLWILLLYFLVILMHAPPTICTEAPTASPNVLPAWQSGDVKLENGSSPADGYVKLYLDLRNGTAGWRLVCSPRYTATEKVICKQLGYVGAAPHTAAKAKRSAVFNGDAVWLFNDWSCNPHSNATHILQCVKPANINRDSYNYPCSLLHLTCETQPSYSPIDNSLRLYRDPFYTNVPSFGAVQVYFTADPSWGFITAGTFTASPFTMVAADTVCRQLGYTNAVTYGKNATPFTSHDYTKTWFEGSNCSKDWLQSCFSCCYNRPLEPCGDKCGQSDVVFVQCTFDIGYIYEQPQYEWTWNCNNQSPDDNFCTPTTPIPAMPLLTPATSGTVEELIRMSHGSLGISILILLGVLVILGLNIWQQCIAKRCAERCHRGERAHLNPGNGGTD